MANDPHAFGIGSEELAVAHLQRIGYHILERNYRTRLGEVDIVARHQGSLVFVEVKARRSTRFGHPKWALTPAKQRKISMVALTYLKQHNAMHAKARFDVVTVQKQADRTLVEVIPNAFELAYPF